MGLPAALLAWTARNPEVLYLTPPGMALGTYELQGELEREFNPITGETGGNKMVDIIPGIDINWENILPGGAPFITKEGPASAWLPAWIANGTQFYRGPMGYLGCYTRAGVWKQWKPYHPIVFGKRTDAGKLARVANKHKNVYKELHKLFGRHEVRSKIKR